MYRLTDWMRPASARHRRAPMTPPNFPDTRPERASLSRPGQSALTDLLLALTAVCLIGLLFAVN